MLPLAAHPIRLIIEGAELRVRAAAAQRGVKISEDLRLHHGLRYSRALEEYVSVDFENSPWNRTYVVAESRFLERIRDWFSETSRAESEGCPPGTLLYVSYPIAPKRRIKWHMGPSAPFELAWKEAESAYRAAQKP